MPWNPGKYDEYKAERSQPFFDLLALCPRRNGVSSIDLGCGTGELTAQLSGCFRDSKILGIDASAEMLAGAGKFENTRLRFEQKSIERQMEEHEMFDMIFSNAALQWCENHALLFPKIISKINSGGILAVQVPSNHDAPTHEHLRTLAGDPSFRGIFNGWKRDSPVLGIEAYARILFENGGRDIRVFEKVYPHVLKDAGAVFEWTGGTAMIPYLERLPDGLRQEFKARYRAMLDSSYPGSPVFFPFRRTFIYAEF